MNFKTAHASIFRRTKGKMICQLFGIYNLVLFMKMILVKMVLHAIIGKCSTMLVALDSILSTNKNQRIVTITIICS